jgi:hypothetical protein
MSSPNPPDSPERPLRTDRTGLVILLLATLAGLWLGLAGPDLSPVSPGSVPMPSLTSLIGTVGGGVGP